MEESKVVVIRSFGSLGEAQLCKALLESAGIEARMSHDIAAQVIPVYGAMMDVDVLVSEDDLAKAEEVLSAAYDENEFKEQTGTARKKKSEMC